MSVLDVMDVLLLVDEQHGTSASASAGLSILGAKLSTENGNLLQRRLRALGACVVGIADDCGIRLPVESIVAFQSVAPVSTVG